MTTDVAPPAADLLLLAEQRLSVLLVEDSGATLDAVLKRLFDPDEPLTVCAFASAL